MSPEGVLRADSETPTKFTVLQQRDQEEEARKKVSSVGLEMEELSKYHSFGKKVYHKLHDDVYNTVLDNILNILNLYFTRINDELI